MHSAFHAQAGAGSRFFSSERDSATTLGCRHREPPCVVIMGVAGCGKSSLGQCCAREWGVPLLEGDDFHPDENIAKMREGHPLSDEDRTVWLDALSRKLPEHAATGVVLTCSALRQRYRDVLRTAAVPSLRFVFLSISLDDARVRVASRPGHLFPASLVASQFETLEDPSTENGVLSLDAMRPTSELACAVTKWVFGRDACRGRQP